MFVFDMGQDEWDGLGKGHNVKSEYKEETSPTFRCHGRKARPGPEGCRQEVP